MVSLADTGAVPLTAISTAASAATAPARTSTSGPASEPNADAGGVTCGSVSTNAHHPGRVRSFKGQDFAEDKLMWAFPQPEPNPYQLEWDDLIDAIDHLVAAGIADPTRYR